MYNIIEVGKYPIKKIDKEARMYVTRYSNPYREIRRGFELMNSLLNSIETAKEENVVGDFVPAVNTREEENAYVIELDVPGIKKEDIEITTEDNILTISGERKYNDGVNEDDYYKIESVYGKFARSFTLPEKVDVENINATTKDGVLEVVIPKLETAENKPKKIEIK
jgi:HSP20 family protein